MKANKQFWSLTLRCILPAGLLSSVGQSYSVCQENINQSLAKVDKGIANPACKSSYTEGRNKAAKYCPQGRRGQKAALCPLLMYMMYEDLFLQAAELCFKCLQLFLTCQELYNFYG
mgnify:CR=1 FL=1